MRQRVPHLTRVPLCLSSYTQYAPSVAPIYKALAPKLYIAVFSGDVDSCVPYPGTEANVDLLGYPVKVRDVGAKALQAARLTPRCTHRPSGRSGRWTTRSLATTRRTTLEQAPLG